MFKVERKKVMTKNYIQPTIEVMAVNSIHSICAASGGEDPKTVSIINIGTQSYSTESDFK